MELPRDENAIKALGPEIVQRLKIVSRQKLEPLEQPLIVDQSTNGWSRRYWL
jgi:hypothetical protein